MTCVVIRFGSNAEQGRMVAVLWLGLVCASLQIMSKAAQHRYQGLSNRGLVLVGLERFQMGWLGDSSAALLAVLITSTWFHYGFHMLIFMAGMSSIPHVYYDAARIQTRSWFHLTRYVTLPLLREQILISFVLIFSGAFGLLMGLLYITTTGGPNNATEIMGLYMQKRAFPGSQYGLASAVSLLMLFIVFGIVIWQAMRIARERLEYLRATQLIVCPLSLRGRILADIGSSFWHQ